MPDGNPTNDYPEELLAGADRPRPLPAVLRSRLKVALEAAALQEAAAGTASRPLSAEVRDKLETSLRVDETEGNGPGPSPEGNRPESKWRTWAPRLTVVAAVLIALGIFVPSLAHGPGPGATHTAAGTIGTAGTTGTAGTHGSRPGPSALRAVPPKAVFLPANGGFAGGSSKSPAASSVATAPGATAPAPTAPPAVLGPDKSAPGQPSAASAAVVPVVGRVTPDSGPVAGGNWVTLRGENMGGAGAVYFGQVPAARVSVVSRTELRALAPPHPAGTVDLVVKGPAGLSKVAPSDRYSFTS